MLTQVQRAKIDGAGFVRFVETGGHVEVCETDDGRSLAPLAGEVSRPRSR